MQKYCNIYATEQTEITPMVGMFIFFRLTVKSLFFDFENPRKADITCQDFQEDLAVLIERPVPVEFVFNFLRVNTTAQRHFCSTEFILVSLVFSIVS